MQYGGNPVSCAVANAVMQVIEDQGLAAHAKEVGEHLLERCRELQQRHALIGDVRGVGLFVGIELVTDRAARTPATAEAQHVLSRMKDERILLSSDGPDRNVIKLKPPMVFSMQNVDTVVNVLDQVLAELEDLDADMPVEPVNGRHSTHAKTNGSSGVNVSLHWNLKQYSRYVVRLTVGMFSVLRSLDQNRLMSFVSGKQREGLG